MSRCYSELVKLDTFEERFEYLKLGGSVGSETFGYDRYLNQLFYKSQEWRSVRNSVIVRDGGCDLGIPGREIVARGWIHVHHMNPVTCDQIIHRDSDLLNPEYLITVLRSPTHLAIHYGDESLLLGNGFRDRTPNDTTPWLL